ncbi:gluconate 2-dehydrogenase subunit 3 family protein [Streptomyces anulatus]|uniref:gluconate 2-dehydrogenase subunit 3 family protein n=1 Tax=Streptomyces anulatus TaxID=1892 RepID=UPI003414F6A7
MSLFARRRSAPGPSPSTRDTATALTTIEAGIAFGLRDERMPSRIPTLHFTVSVNGTWSLDGNAPPLHHAPDSLARIHLREQAARILRRHTVLAIPAAQDAVNAVIARPLTPEPWLTVHGMACLTVSDADRALAEEHLRRAQHGDLEREETRRRIGFLRAILSDPDQRTAWWIDQYPERLAEMELMTAAVKTVTPPRDSASGTVEEEVARFVDQLLAEMRTPQQREVFLRALTQTLSALGSNDLRAAAARWMPACAIRPGADVE